MPYDFSGRDLDRPNEGRSPVEPGDPLADAFERWLDDAANATRREIGGSVSEELYDRAVAALADVDRVDPQAATSLLVSYRESIPPTAGLFLSAAYDRTDDSVVVFDAETPVDLKWLGFRLDADTALLVDADVASVMATDAAGLVVNRATIDSYFGYSADAAVVNHVDGACATMGFGAARAAVNYGSVGSSEDAAPRLTLQFGASSGGEFEAGPDEVADRPALTAVLDEWREGLSGDAGSVRKFLAGKPRSPRRALVADLEAAIGDATREEAGSKDGAGDRGERR